jgi:hypothetical protein
MQLRIESIHQNRGRAQGCDPVVISAQALPVDNFLDIYLRCCFHPAGWVPLCIRTDSILCDRIKSMKSPSRERFATQGTISLKKVHSAHLLARHRTGERMPVTL